MDIYYVNGDFVGDEQALISVNDLSVLRGFGVFDFLRTYNGIPFHLADHLMRLQRSADLIGLKLPHSPSKIGELIMETLSRNSHQESNIRIVVTGGLSDDGIMPGDSPQLLIMITAANQFPFIDDKALEPHRAASMDLVGADTHFCAQAISESITETRAAIAEHIAGIYAIHEGRGSFRILSDNAVRMT